MKVWLSCLLVVLLASACASSATTLPAPTAAGASKIAGAAPVKTWVETRGFRKSDAKYFAATGRPQLVEFFAFW
jgi:hypothetical protein